MSSNQDAEINQIIDVAQNSIPDVGLVMLAILTFFALIFSLLMYRRVDHMVHVLPTPLSPHLKTAAVGYSVFVFATLAAIIITLL